MRKELKCKVCNKIFHVWPSKIKDGATYCSRDCYYKSRIGVVCKFKGKKVNRKSAKNNLTEEGRLKMIERNKNRIWTPEMKERLKNRKRPDWIYFRGDKNPNWRHDKTDSERLMALRKTRDYEIWRQAVFKRDNYKCIWCGDDKGGNLNADHIKPFAYYPELRFAIDNGRTLCERCHKTTDTWGGKAKKYKCTH